MLVFFLYDFFLIRVSSYEKAHVSYEAQKNHFGQNLKNKNFKNLVSNFKKNFA